jgi:DNA repair exonuclease SbcCD ATPase subunit
MSDFLINFENSLNKLDKLKDNIADRFRNQDNFSNEILSQLTEINNKVKDLSKKINELKENIDVLQKQINQIDGVIEGLNQDKAILNRQMEQLKNDKSGLLSDNEEIKKKQIALQQEINECEERIATLTSENTTTQSEIDSLKSANESLTQQYSTDRDVQKQEFAEKMSEQQELHMRQLSDNQEAFNEEIKILVSRVDECQLKINDLETEKANREAEMSSINSQMTSKESEINGYTNRIIELERTNQDLMSRIVSATDVIERSIEALDNLTREIPNIKTQTDIRNLFSQINESIDGINVLLQPSNIRARGEPEIAAREAPGTPSLSRSGTQPVSFSEMGQDEGEEKQEVSSNLASVTEFNVSGQKLTLSQLQQLVRQKLQTIRNKNSEFAKKLQGILDLNDKIESMTTIQSKIDNFGIQIKQDGTIVGGKTRRKNKKYNVISKTKKGIKQKGGFVWNTHSKRKTITTPSFTRKSSSRNSTSRRSSSTNISSRKKHNKKNKSSRR